MRETRSHPSVRVVFFSLPFLLAVVITILLVTETDLNAPIPTLSQVRSWQHSWCTVISPPDSTLNAVEVLAHTDKLDIAINATVRSYCVIEIVWPAYTMYPSGLFGATRTGIEQFVLPVPECLSGTLSSNFMIDASDTMASSDVFLKVNMTFSCLLDDGQQPSQAVSQAEYAQMETFTLINMIARPLAVVGVTLELLGTLAWVWVSLFSARQLLLLVISHLEDTSGMSTEMPLLESECEVQEDHATENENDMVADVESEEEPIPEHERVGTQAWMNHMMGQVNISGRYWKWIRSSMGESCRVVWAAWEGSEQVLMVDAIVFSVTMLLLYGLVQFVGFELLFDAEETERMLEWSGWAAVCGICLATMLHARAGRCLYVMVVDANENLRAISLRDVLRFHLRQRPTTDFEQRITTVAYPVSVWIGSSSICFRSMKGRSRVTRWSRLVEYRNLTEEEVFWAELIMQRHTESSM